MPIKHSRRLSQGKASLDQSPREQAESTLRAFGPANTSIVRSLVRLLNWTSSTGFKCCLSQSMSWYSLAAAEPYQTLAGPRSLCGRLAIVASPFNMPWWLRKYPKPTLPVCFLILPQKILSKKLCLSDPVISMRLKPLTSHNPTFSWTFLTSLAIRSKASSNLNPRVVLKSFVGFIYSTRSHPFTTVNSAPCSAKIGVSGVVFAFRPAGLCSCGKWNRNSFW